MLIKNISEQDLALPDLDLIIIGPDAEADLYELLYHAESRILNSEALGTAIDAGLVEAIDRFGFAIENSADLQKPTRLLPGTKQIELAKLTLLQKSAKPFSLLDLHIASIADCAYRLFSYVDGLLQDVTEQKHWPNGGAIYVYIWPKQTLSQCPYKLNVQYTLALRD